MPKMVLFRVYFWTNNMKKDGGYIRKRAWNKGVVHLSKNEEHGIRPDKQMFNGVDDLPAAIRKLAKRNRIRFE